VWRVRCSEYRSVLRVQMVLICSRSAWSLAPARSGPRRSMRTAPGTSSGEGVQAFLDACTGSDFQRVVLIEGPAVLGPGAWGDLVEQHGLGLLRTWLDRAMEDRQIDPLPADPLARLLAALIGEASLYIGQATDPGRARTEAGATIDRILTGLRPNPRR
jgi:hypothetical protein